MKNGTRVGKETKWAIDQSHSDISFNVSHLMIAHVKGSFKKFDASIYTTDKDFTTAEIDLWIDVDSLNTGVEKRDEHLKSVDFFDMPTHKQITFVADTIGPADLTGKHELWGELTIRGISKNIKLEVQTGGFVIDPWGNEKVGFSISGQINRSDWGLVWNTALESGGILVGEEVAIACELELQKVCQDDLSITLEPADCKKCK